MNYQGVMQDNDTSDSRVFRLQSAELFDSSEKPSLEVRLQSMEPAESEVEAASNDLLNQRIEIDFKGVTKLSSAELGKLIRVNREARKMDLAIVLVNTGKTIRDIFSLTRLDRSFTVNGPVMSNDTTVPT